MNGLQIKKPTNFQLLLAILFLTLPIKIYYSLSRPLYDSGPDAPQYVSIITSIARGDFWRTTIVGIPQYPVGFPFLNSFVVDIFGNEWIKAAQILQIISFTISLILYFNIILKYTSENIALFSTLILALSPAWAVANGEAMYETYLFAFLCFGSFLLLKSQEPGAFRTIHLLCGGSLLGFCGVIHPRILLVLPLFIFLIYRHFVTSLAQKFLLGFTLILPMGIFAFRNLLVENVFSLSTSIMPSLKYHKSLRSAANLEEVPGLIWQNFPTFLKECIENLLYFWSPYSGSLRRGSWYHNVSLLSILQKMSLDDIPIALVFSLANFTLCCIGLYSLKKKDWNFYIFSSAFLLILWCTDIFLFGDSRHRLIAMFVTAPLLSLGITSSCKKFSTRIFKKSSHSYRRGEI
jgi:hypothetical protein